MPFNAFVRPKHFPAALLSERKRPQKPLQSLFSWKVSNRNVAARNKKTSREHDVRAPSKRVFWQLWAECLNMFSCSAMSESNCCECWDKFDSANFVQTFEMSWTSAIWAYRKFAQMFGTVSDDRCCLPFGRTLRADLQQKIKQCAVTGSAVILTFPHKKKTGALIQTWNLQAAFKPSLVEKRLSRPVPDDRVVSFIEIHGRLEARAISLLNRLSCPSWLCSTKRVHLSATRPEPLAERRTSCDAGSCPRSRDEFQNLELRINWLRNPRQQLKQCLGFP